MPKCLDNDGKYVWDNDPSDKPYCVKKKPSVLYVTLTFSEDGFRRLAKKAISVGEKVTICCFCLWAMWRLQEHGNEEASGDVGELWWLLVGSWSASAFALFGEVKKTLNQSFVTIFTKSFECLVLGWAHFSMVLSWLLSCFQHIEFF